MILRYVVLSNQQSKTQMDTKMDNQKKHIHVAINRFIVSTQVYFDAFSGQMQISIHPSIFYIHLSTQGSLDCWSQWETIVLEIWKYYFTFKGICIVPIVPGLHACVFQQKVLGFSKETRWLYVFYSLDDSCCHPPLAVER